MTALTWNVTIDDSSFLYNYWPYSDGDLSGWQATRDPNGEGGGSYHRTNSNGSSVTLSFYGTGFQLIGYSTALYDVKVDEEPAVVGLVGPASGVLYFRDNLTMGSHVMTLTSRATSNVTALTFDKVILSNSGRNDSSPTTRTDNSNTEAIEYVGTSWTTRSVAEVPNRNFPRLFHTTNQSGDYLNFKFTGSAVIVYGSSGSDHGLYSVGTDGVDSLIYNASTSALIGNTVIYYKDGLDATQPHSLQMMDISRGANSRLSISYIETYSDPLTSPSSSPTTEDHHKPNVGVIVGPVVAVILVLAVACAVVFWNRRRNRYPAAKSSTPTPLIDFQNSAVHESTMPATSPGFSPVYFGASILLDDQAPSCSYQTPLTAFREKVPEHEFGFDSRSV